MHFVGRWLMALAIVAGATMASATGLVAQEATPTGGEAALPAGCTVAADGLIKNHEQPYFP